MRPDQPKRFCPETIVICVIVGIALPMVCFGLAAQDNPLGPEWQSGRPKAYAGLLLSRGPAGPFYPFILYAMISLGLVLADLPRFGRLFVVRFGLLTGVVLALQYTAVMGVSFWWGDPWYVSIPATGMFIAVPLGLFGLWVWARNKMGWRLAVLFAIPLLLIPPILVALFGGGVSLDNVPYSLFVLAMGGAPFVAFATYGVVLLWTWRRVTPATMRTWLKTLVAGTWIAAYAVAWWYAILTMLEEYAALPTSAPGCYVATAAARGHPRLVKSEPVALKDGTVLHANDQLRTLKCAELALKAASPRLHRACRRVYDTVGVALAARLRHPLLADAAYLTLKPFEWLAWGALRLLIPQMDDLRSRIYRG